MKGNRNKSLPSFRSVDELVAFFETYDMGEYWEQLPKAELEMISRKEGSRGESRSNTGKRLTPTQVKQLRQLASRNTPTRVISLKLGRTENAVRTKASEKGVSLKSKDQSSYYSRRK